VRSTGSLIVGAFEHPERRIRGRTVPEVLSEVCAGALDDAGLSIADVDGFFCSPDVPGFGSLAMAEYLGLGDLSYIDTTEGGGASYPMHVGHAAAAIAAGKCSVALVAMAGLPLSDPRRHADASAPESPYEDALGIPVPASYALAAMRHMHQFGTTGAQLAEVKVAASYHAQFNPHARLRRPVTVDEVLESPMVSDPLHRLDCCITTDGGGALVVVSDDVARALGRRGVRISGHGEAFMHAIGGTLDLTTTGAARSGPRAYAEAGIGPADIDYASIYDSFTITVLMSLEDLGFCDKGAGGQFVSEGGLMAPYGALPVNTDGGGLCNNHPGYRGGMIRTIEAVRQLREEAAPEVQVPDCEWGLVQAHGYRLGSRSVSSTLILGREDAR